MRHLVLLSAFFALVGSAHAAGPVDIQVPEIDALAGLSALGVVGCIATLIWERRRK